MRVGKIHNSVLDMTHVGEFAGPRINNGMDHKHLLESVRWQQLRWFVHERDEGRCVICGDPGSDTHHWTYQWGFFNPTAVSLVCRQCHQIWQGESPDHLADDHNLKPNLIRISEIARALGRKCR